METKNMRPDDEDSEPRSTEGSSPPELDETIATPSGSGTGSAETLDVAPTDPNRSSEQVSPSSIRGVLTRLTADAAKDARYDVDREIGRGGMGAILEVRDRDLRRTLAMKVLLRSSSPTDPANTPVDDASLGRFIEEAQVTGQLDHPGVVPVHELGVDSNGRVYFTMRLVEGRDLSKIWECVAKNEDDWNLPRAIGVMLRVCEAMAYAHSKGVIHRDLKPANIMVGRFGEVYVMDWGLAKVLGSTDKVSQDGRDDAHTRTPKSNSVDRVRTDRTDSVSADSPLRTLDGNVVGTPSYMPPEQAEGDISSMGPHSDVYSLGAMLYHLLAGRTPYTTPGEKVTPFAILERVVEAAPPSLDQIAPGAPAEVVAICQKAMARRAEDRYPGTQEMAEDLRAFIEGRVVKAHRTGTLIELKKLVSRNKGITGALTLAMAAIMIGSVVSIFYAIEAHNQAVEAREQKQAAIKNGERANRENQNFRQLADVKTLRDLLQSRSELRVRSDQDLVEIDDWLTRAEQFSTRRTAHARALEETRAQGALVPAPRQRPQVETRSNATPDSVWTFEDPTAAFLHTALEELNRDGTRLAESVLERTRALLPGAEASRTNELWKRIITEVPEIVAPDLGLVPLGKNAQGLWEFWHHESGVRPRELKDLSSIADWPVSQWLKRKRRRPTSDPRTAVSRWRIEAETGLIFVLVPSGLVTPVSDERAEATFISKYEMTRAQWERLTGSDPSRSRGGDGTEPVERVGWLESSENLARWGLEIPTRAAWERAARGGTSTKWWTGNKKGSAESGGFVSGTIADRPKPVGRYRANPFGLHDTIGNVWEWCWSPETSSPSARGSGYVSSSSAARPTGRIKRGKLGSQNGIGLRPSRSVSP